MSDIQWEELAGALFEEAGDALFLFDPDSEEVREVNPMAQRLSGFTRREMIGVKVTYLFRSEVEGGLQRLRHAFRRTGLFHSQEGFWLRGRRNGTWVPVNLTITRLHTEPRVLGLITARDITERKQAEETLHQSATRNRLLLEQMPAILWTTGPDLRFTSCVGAGMAALPTGERPLETIYDVFASDGPEHPAILAHLAALRGEPATYDVEFGGHAWHAHVEPMRDPGGAIIGTIGIALDQTERLRAVEALRASEATSRTLIENLTQSIFLKDKDLRFIVVNKPFCEGLGLSEAAILGRTDFDFFPTHLADKYRQDDLHVLQTGERMETEEQCLLQGRLRTVQTIKKAVRDENGQPIAVLGVFWDVTDQRNMEAQLRQAHKMEAVGQLAGGIAHDFNNLLTGILGNLSLALADLPPHHPCHELLSSAETAALRAAELTRQMLGFSRRAPLVPRAVDLNACIEETVRLLRRTFDPRIALTVLCARDLWQVKADSGQVNQVLMNLCLNARDAMPQGGQLTLETRNVTLGPPQPSSSLDRRPGDFVHLSVRDTGCGMTPEIVERIFEPFFTTKEPGKGTGLGLAMVFGIIKVHTGWIECRSEVGVGTSFDIYLPRLPIVCLEGPQEAPVTPPVRGHETVLLADDEDVVNRLGQAILQRQGYRVFHAADGAEAVEIYRQRPEEIDLVILDLAMPRLSGPETLRELRKVNPGVRVLISSGYSSDEDLRAVERQGVAGFVAKPYRPAELARQVRLALDQPRQAPHLVPGPA